jgi:hypothetical protein
LSQKGDSIQSDSVLFDAIILEGNCPEKGIYKKIEQQAIAITGLTNPH